jgi:hypothetical protein
LRSYIVRLVMPLVMCFVLGWLMFIGLEAMFPSGLLRLGLTTICMSLLVIGVFLYLVLDHSDRKLCRISCGQLICQVRIMINMKKSK